MRIRSSIRECASTCRTELPTPEPEGRNVLLGFRFVGMELIISLGFLAATYFSLLAGKKRKVRAAERLKKLTWDRNVNKLFGRWHSY
ncbi:MAG: hypothetical protein KF744_13050 [Taibaiella sp.]|nr:hypothetical protein [Taibaiella sp.]